MGYTQGGGGQRPVHCKTWPYYLPIWIILSYFIESGIIDGLGLDTFSGKQFLFLGMGSVPAIYLATYIYRYERFDMITRNSDLIMLFAL